MGKNQDSGSGINIRDPQHCENPLKTLDWAAQRGGEVGSRRGRNEGAQLEGENKRGGGA
jgi:hypothetical protein